MSFKLDQTTKIMVCGMTPVFRSMITQQLHSVDLKNTVTVGDIRIAIERLESENFDWIILDMDSRNSTNGINFLQLIAETPELAHIRVSFMVTQEDEQYLSKAFESGLLSYHAMISTGDQLRDSFSELKKFYTDYQSNGQLIVTEYLMRYLKDKGFSDDLVHYLQNMAGSGYYNRIDILLKLAEAYLLNGDKDEGMSLIKQINLIDPLQETNTGTLIETLIALGDEALEKRYLPFPQIPLFKTLISDKATSDRFSKCCEALTIATEALNKDAPILDQVEESDYVVLDWKDTKCPPRSIIEEIHTSKFANIPVIALVPEDLNIEEHHLPMLGIDAVFKVPLSAPCMAKELCGLLMRQKSGQYLRRHIIYGTLHQKFKQSEIIKSEYFRQAPISCADRHLIDAWISLQKDESKRVRDFCLKSLSQPPCNNQLALEILGTSLASEQDYEGSAACFEKINIPSIKSIVNIHKNHIHKKQNIFSLPSHLKHYTDLIMGSAISRCHTKGPKDSIGVNQFLEGLVAFDDHQEMKALIAYHLGTSFLRWGFLPEASDALAISLKFAKDEVLTNAKEALKEVRSQLSGNPKAEIPDQKPIIQNLKKTLRRATKLANTDLNARFMFKNQQNKVPTDFLTKTKLEFKPRATIKKSNSYAS